ncbi:MAG: hypothetical protein AMXMBFR47_41400 [Planctomycetota bacterium]
MARLLCILFLTVCVVWPPRPAAAQVTWSTNEASSVARARREDRLLIFFFTFDEEGDERGRGNWVDRRREAVRRVFSTPAVASIVRRAFVPVAADYKLNFDLRWRLGRVSPNEVVITQPDLTVLARIDARRPVTADSVRETLEECLDKWVREVYTRIVQPVLEDEEASPAALQKALALARKMSLKSSDDDVIALLDRKNLDARVRTLAFDVLAAISTESAVRTLVEHAARTDAAAKALTRCTAAALAVLSEYLDDPDAPEFLPAYRAVVAITRTPGKKDGFWISADDETQSAEIQRIREVARRMRSTE